MPKENAPELFGLFHYIHQLSDETKRGMKTSLEECPRCHFVMLEGVLTNIEQHGTDGNIYVSDLAAAVRQPMPAVSRWLRQLEQDGLIERITDPNDRRKTLVHVTEKGLASSRQCELALSGYFDRVARRLTPQQLTQLQELKDVLLDAVMAENAEFQTKSKGDNQNG